MSRPTSIEMKQAYQQGYDRFVHLYGAFSRSQLPVHAATPQIAPVHMVGIGKAEVLRNNYYCGWKVAYDEKIESCCEVWPVVLDRKRMIQEFYRGKE